MPVMYTPSPSVEADVVEALKRVYTKRDLARAVAAHLCADEKISSQTEESRLEVSRKEIRLSAQLFRENDAQAIIEMAHQAMKEMSLCEPGGTVLFIDKLGQHTLDMDKLHMLRLGDIFREADALLTQNNIAVVAEHFHRNIGWDLGKIIPENAGDRVMAYTLSGYKGKITFEAFSSEHVQLALETDFAEVQERWDHWVKPEIEKAFQSQLARLSPKASGVLAFKAEASNPEILDSYAINYG